MSDAGTRYTDSLLDETEHRIVLVYRQAQKDIADRLADFVKRHLARDAKKRQQLAAGKITLDEYASWLRGQDFIGERWREKQKAVADILLNADSVARDYVRRSEVRTFAENANQVARDLDAGVSFDIYDETTVNRLIEERPELLPRRKLDRDKASGWYQVKISNALARGIISGDSIPQISRRIAEETGMAAGKATLMYARTAMTGAQNAGRIERLHEASRMGIQVRKKWLATQDSRTRDAHRDLDGQERDVDEPFLVDGHEIDYPGDMKARPELVWNCRCTLTYVYPKYAGSKEEDPFTDDAYSDARKNAALNTSDQKQIDDALRPTCSAVWQKASKAEREAAFEYTRHYEKYNDPLRGYDTDPTTWKKTYVGVGKSDLNAGKAQNGEKLDHLTDLISRSRSPVDIWLTRGASYVGLDKFLGVDEDLLRYGEESALQDALIGAERTEYGFMSCGSASNAGFRHLDVQMRIYCPKGTKMMYMEPFSALGFGARSADWDGITQQGSFGIEQESLIQQGTSFKITGVRRSGNKLILEMEVRAQPSVQRWKGE